MNKPTRVWQYWEELGWPLEARQWAAGLTPALAWNQCRNPEWMMWWAWRERNNPLDSLLDALWFGISSAPRDIEERLAAETINAALSWATDPTESRLDGLNRLVTALGHVVRRNPLPRLLACERAGIAVLFEAGKFGKEWRDLSTHEAAYSAKLAAIASMDNGAMCAHYRSVLDPPTSALQGRTK